MAGKFSMAARAEVTAAIRERYWASGKAAKGAILDEFVAVTGVHRKHAIRLLSLKGAVRRPRGRPKTATVAWSRKRWSSGRRRTGFARSA